MRELFSLRWCVLGTFKILTQALTSGSLQALLTCSWAYLAL